STQDQLRTAVGRVLPNVVLVIAENATQSSVGSGVVVSQSGHILTAAHVIAGAETVSVVLPSGEQRPANVLAADSPFTDLAVLQVPAQGLRQIAIGSSARLQPGDFVIAVSGGTGQYGLGNAVSLGVVSGTGKTLPRDGVILQDLVQTDAAINSGDS